MLSAKAFTITTILVALFCVFLSVTAAPVAAPGRFIKRQDTNQTELESDSIPVSSDGGNLTPYNPNDTVPANVTDNGNSAKGDGTGLKLKF